TRVDPECTQCREFAAGHDQQLHVGRGSDRCGARAVAEEGDLTYHRAVDDVTDDDAVTFDDGVAPHDHETLVAPAALPGEHSSRTHVDGCTERGNRTQLPGRAVREELRRCQPLDVPAVFAPSCASHTGDLRAEATMPCS